MVDVTPAIPGGRKTVQGYGDGGFVIDSETVAGSVILFGDRMLRWPVATFGEVTIESLKPIIDAADAGILVLGCGAKIQFVSPEFRAALRAHDLVVETMDTGAACRTYSVLVAEERRVAAALVAV